MKNNDSNSQIKKLLKSLDIVKGHKLTLYKCDYWVMETNDRMTLLKDSNGNPVAFETKKLKQVMMRSMKNELSKALAMGKPPGPSAPAASAAAPSGGEGKGSIGKMHGGKIRVDKVDSKGRKYHYWVDAVHGSRHADHKSDSPGETHLHEEDQKLHGKMLDAIHKYAHPSDVKEIAKKLDDWIQAKAAYTHLKEAHNQLAKESGGVPTSTVNNIAAKQAEHLKKFHDLKKTLAASHQKKLGGSSGD